MGGVYAKKISRKIFGRVLRTHITFAKALPGATPPPLRMLTILELMISTLTVSMLTIRTHLVSTHIVSTLTISTLRMLQRSIDAPGALGRTTPRLPAAQNRPREDYPTVPKHRKTSPKLVGTHILCLFCALQHGQ